MVKNRQNSVSLVWHISDRLTVVSLADEPHKVYVIESGEFSDIMPRLGYRSMENLVTYVTGFAERHP